jgi:hypothetical protein
MSLDRAAEITTADIAAARGFWERWGKRLLRRLLDADGPGDTMETQRLPYLVRLKPEFAEVYKGILEVGRDYHALFSLYSPDHMSIMGSTIDRADQRHFDIREGD